MSEGTRLSIFVMDPNAERQDTIVRGLAEHGYQAFAVPHEAQTHCLRHCSVQPDILVISDASLKVPGFAMPTAGSVIRYNYLLSSGSFHDAYIGEKHLCGYYPYELVAYLCGDRP